RRKGFTTEDTEHTEMAGEGEAPVGGASRRADLLLCPFEALVDFVPVHGVPPRGKVVGAAVLVLQVIRVLPHVIAEDRKMPLGKRVVLVRRGDDLQFAAIPDEPSPPRAELLRGGIVELLLQIVKAAKVLLD